MATINSKKLLPQSKSSLAKTEKPFLVPVANILPKKGTRLLKPVEGGESSSLKNKLIQINKIISSTYLLEKSESIRKRKEREREKSEQNERSLETKKLSTNQVNSNDLKRLPGQSILDRIKRFIGFTILGYLFNNFGKYLPKLLELGKKLQPALKAFGDLSKVAFDGFVSFVDTGYKEYDKVRAAVKNIGGEGAQKTFDEFSGELNKLLNGAIMASMLIASTSPKGVAASGGAAATAAAKVGGDILERGALSRVNDSFSRYIAGKANIGDRSRLLRRGYIGVRQALSKGGTKALEKGAARTAATQGAKQLATQGAKQSLKSLVGIPIIGSLIGFIIDTVVFREKPTRAAAGAIGSAIGQGIGIAVAGGTTFGLGAGVGMFFGGLAGDWLGKTLYDGLTKHQSEPIPAKAQGGSVTRGGRRTGGAVARTVRRAPRTPQRIAPQKTQPGRDVGGIKKIEMLYGEDKPGQKSGLAVLKNTSNRLKGLRAPLGINALMGASVDLAMGQKPDRRLYQQIGNNFGDTIANLIDAETNISINNISKSLAMSGGGSVPSRETKRNGTIGERIGLMVSSYLRSSIESSAASILQEVRKQILMKGGLPSLTPGDGGGPITQDQQEAFEKIRKIAEKVGSPNPSVTAAIAMLETGWLSNPNSVYFASGKTNPFGQTGKGPKGSVIGKDGQEHAIYNSLEEGVRAHVDRWKSSYIGKTPEEIIENIRTGRGPGAPGMYNTSPSWTSKVLSTFQSGTQPRISPKSVPGNLKDTGLKDSSGRSIKLKGVIADAFIDMAAAARKDGINLGSGISNAFRDPAHNARVGGAQGSRHLTGEAFDINWDSSAGKWIRNNASRFGFGYNPYSSQSTHFDWVGGYSPKSTPKQPPASPPPPGGPKQQLTRSNQWDPSQSGLKFNSETGMWEKASLAPVQPSRDISSLRRYERMEKEFFFLKQEIFV